MALTSTHLFAVPTTDHRPPPRPISPGTVLRNRKRTCIPGLVRISVERHPSGPASAHTRPGRPRRDPRQNNTLIVSFHCLSVACFSGPRLHVICCHPGLAISSQIFSRGWRPTPHAPRRTRSRYRALIDYLGGPPPESTRLFSRHHSSSLFSLVLSAKPHSLPQEEIITNPEFQLEVEEPRGNYNQHIPDSVQRKCQNPGSHLPKITHHKPLFSPPSCTSRRIWPTITKKKFPLFLAPALRQGEPTQKKNLSSPLFLFYLIFPTSSKFLYLFFFFSSDIKISFMPVGNTPFFTHILSGDNPDFWSVRLA